MTKQKAEDALYNSEKLLRSLTDASPDAIYVKDRNSRWLFANPALERIAGKPAVELLGKTDVEIYSNPEVGRAILENDKKIMESSKAETFEEFIDMADGRHVFISVKSPRFDENGAVVGLVGISHDITNRKRREEQLKESQKKYLDLTESTGDFIWEMDAQGRYTYCSPQMEKLWGLKPVEMIGKTPFDLMPAEDKTKALEYFMDIAAHPRAFKGLETSAIVAEGRKVFIETNGIPFFNTEGKLLGFRGISRDVTERKKAEDALNESEELFRRAIEDAPIPVIMHAEDGQVLQLSRTWTELTGYTINHIPDFDTWLTKAAYGEGANAVRDHVHELFEGNQKSIDAEFAIRALNGSIRYWSFSASSPGTLRDGRRFIVGMAVDITERKKAEEAMRAGEVWKATSYYTRNLIETSLAPLVTISVEGKITDVNKATELVTGCSRDELIGSDFSSYFTDPKKAASGYKQVFKKGFVTDYPLAIRSKSGKLIDVLYNASLYRDSKGNVQGVFAAARNVTKRKRAENELRKYQEQLEKRVEKRTKQARENEAAALKAELMARDRAIELEKMQVKLEKKASEVEEYATHMEELAQERLLKLKDSERLAAIGATAGMVGHDIRNPLQSISGDVYLLLRECIELPDGEQKKSIRESLEGIEESVNYINKIVQDLQDFAKPLTPTMQETNLQKLCEEVLFKNGVPERIKASCQIEKKVKKIATDPDLLKRVLSNLVNNAVQAMHENGKLVLHAYNEAGNVVITVSDTGAGIPEKIRPSLFMPLVTTKSKGQGFGLAVVKRMTEALGGTVTFKSEIGMGTSFTITLPSREK